MSDDELLPMNRKTLDYLNMAYSRNEEALVATEETRIGECVGRFMMTAQNMPYVLSMCAEHCDQEELAGDPEAIIQGVYWIISPNALFCSVECAQRFSTYVGREQLDRPSNMCDTCNGVNDYPTTTVLGVGNLLIISDSCSMCIGAHPAANAGNN